MTVIPTQNVWFDDAATLAMGEAFDRACKSLQNFGSAPAIIADLIIAAAKNGERDPGRLYEQVLEAYAIEDTSMPLVSVGDPRPCPCLRLRSRTQRDHKPRSPRSRCFLLFSWRPKAAIVRKPVSKIGVGNLKSVQF